MMLYWVFPFVFLRSKKTVRFFFSGPSEKKRANGQNQRPLAGFTLRSLVLWRLAGQGSHKLGGPSFAPLVRSTHPPEHTDGGKRWEKRGGAVAPPPCWGTFWELRGRAGPPFGGPLFERSGSGGVRLRRYPLLSACRERGYFVAPSPHVFGARALLFVLGKKIAPPREQVPHMNQAQPPKPKIRIKYHHHSSLKLFLLIKGKFGFATRLRPNLLKNKKTIKRNGLRPLASPLLASPTVFFVLCFLCKHKKRFFCACTKKRTKKTKKKALPTLLAFGSDQREERLRPKRTVFFVQSTKKTKQTIIKKLLGGATNKIMASFHLWSRSKGGTVNLKKSTLKKDIVVNNHTKNFFLNGKNQNRQPLKLKGFVAQVGPPQFLGSLFERGGNEVAPTFLGEAQKVPHLGPHKSPFNFKKAPPKTFWNQCFDKNRLKNFILWFLLTYGEYRTVEFIEQLKNIGFEYATKAGISLGIEDLKIPLKKSFLLLDAEKKINSALTQYNRGEITGVERFQKMIDTWHRTSEILKQEVIDYFELTDTLNPVYMMAFSGARGNISQVRQLVGMRGLMANPQGQILDFPIRSNFREGLSLTEYIISTYGARKGIVDTALRTANAGYLTRRLVDVAQHIIVSNFDCGTHRGIFLNDMKEGNKIIYSLQNRVIGRVLAKDVFNNTIIPTIKNQSVLTKNWTLKKQTPILRSLGSPFFPEKKAFGFDRSLSFFQGDLKKRSEPFFFREPEKKQREKLRTKGNGSAPLSLNTLDKRKDIMEIAHQNTLFVKENKIQPVFINPKTEQQTNFLELLTRHSNDHVSNDKKRVIFFRNTEISSDLARKLIKISDKIFVRSTLTCETQKSVCQLCYGWSLAQGNLVSIGEAVGVVAAQSIGEPGTQLTMRTFHTGGVFSGDITDQIKAHENGIVNYIEPIAGTLIRTPEGKISFLTKTEGFIEVISFVSGAPQVQSTNKQKKLSFQKMEKKKIYKIPSYTLLYVRHREKVFEKQVLAQISNLSRLRNKRDDAEFTINSEIEGQFLIMKLNLLEKQIGPKLTSNKNRTAFGSDQTPKVRSKRGGVAKPEGLEQNYLDFTSQKKKASPPKDGTREAVSFSLKRTLETVLEASDWGYAWILAGKIYQLPISSQFFPQPGDFVNSKSLMNSIALKVTTQGSNFGFLETNFKDNFFLNKPILFFEINKMFYKKIGYFLKFSKQNFFNNTLILNKPPLISRSLFKFVEKKKFNLNKKELLIIGLCPTTKFFFLNQQDVLFTPKAFSCKTRDVSLWSLPLVGTKSERSTPLVFGSRRAAVNKKRSKLKGETTGLLRYPITLYKNHSGSSFLPSNSASFINITKQSNFKIKTSSANWMKNLTFFLEWFPHLKKIKSGGLISDTKTLQRCSFVFNSMWPIKNILFDLKKKSYFIKLFKSSLQSYFFWRRRPKLFNFQNLKKKSIGRSSKKKSVSFFLSLNFYNNLYFSFLFLFFWGNFFPVLASVFPEKKGSGAGAPSFRQVRSTQNHFFSGNLKKNKGRHRKEEKKKASFFSLCPKEEQSGPKSYPTLVRRKESGSQNKLVKPTNKLTVKQTNIQSTPFWFIKFLSFLNKIKSIQTNLLNQQKTFYILSNIRSLKSEKQQIYNKHLYEKLFYLSKNFYEILQERLLIKNHSHGPLIPLLTNHLPKSYINMYKKNRQGNIKSLYTNFEASPQVTIDIVKKVNNNKSTLQSFVFPFGLWSTKGKTSEARKELLVFPFGQNPRLCFAHGKKRSVKAIKRPLRLLGNSKHSVFLPAVIKKKPCFAVFIFLWGPTRTEKIPVLCTEKKKAFFLLTNFRALPLLKISGSSFPEKKAFEYAFFPLAAGQGPLLSDRCGALKTKSQREELITYKALPSDHSKMTHSNAREIKKLKKKYFLIFLSFLEYSLKIPKRNLFSKFALFVVIQRSCVLRTNFIDFKKIKINKAQIVIYPHHLIQLKKRISSIGRSHQFIFKNQNLTIKKHNVKKNKVALPNLLNSKTIIQKKGWLYFPVLKPISEELLNLVSPLDAKQDQRSKVYVLKSVPNEKKNVYLNFYGATCRADFGTGSNIYCKKTGGDPLEHKKKKILGEATLNIKSGKKFLNVQHSCIPGKCLTHDVIFDNNIYTEWYEDTHSLFLKSEQTTQIIPQTPSLGVTSPLIKITFYYTKKNQIIKGLRPANVSFSCDQNIYITNQSQNQNKTQKNRKQTGFQKKNFYRKSFPKNNKNRPPHSLLRFLPFAFSFVRSNLPPQVGFVFPDHFLLSSFLFFLRSLPSDPLRAKLRRGGGLWFRVGQFFGRLPFDFFVLPLTPQPPLCPKEAATKEGVNFLSGNLIKNKGRGACSLSSRNEGGKKKQSRAVFSNNKQKGLTFNLKSNEFCWVKNPRCRFLPSWLGRNKNKLIDKKKNIFFFQKPLEYSLNHPMEYKNEISALYKSNNNETIKEFGALPQIFSAPPKKFNYIDFSLIHFLLKHKKNHIKKKFCAASVLPGKKGSVFFSFFFVVQKKKQGKGRNTGAFGFDQRQKPGRTQNHFFSGNLKKNKGRPQATSSNLFWVSESRRNFNFKIPSTLHPSLWSGPKATRIPLLRLQKNQSYNSLLVRKQYFSSVLNKQKKNIEILSTIPHFDFKVQYNNSYYKMLSLLQIKGESLLRLKMFSYNSFYKRIFFSASRLRPKLLSKTAVKTAVKSFGAPLALSEAALGSLVQSSSLWSEPKAFFSGKNSERAKSEKEKNKQDPPSSLLFERTGKKTAIKKTIQNKIKKTNSLSNNPLIKLRMPYSFFLGLKKKNPFLLTTKNPYFSSSIKFDFLKTKKTFRKHIKALNKYPKCQEIWFKKSITLTPLLIGYHLPYGFDLDFNIPNVLFNSKKLNISKANFEIPTVIKHFLIKKLKYRKDQNLYNGFSGASLREKQPRLSKRGYFVAPSANKKKRGAPIFTTKKNLWFIKSVSFFSLKLTSMLAQPCFSFFVSKKLINFIQRLGAFPLAFGFALSKSSNPLPRKKVRSKIKGHFFPLYIGYKGPRPKNVWVRSTQFIETTAKKVRIKDTGFFLKLPFLKKKKNFTTLKKKESRSNSLIQFTSCLKTKKKAQLYFRFIKSESVAPPKNQFFFGNPFMKTSFLSSFEGEFITNLTFIKKTVKPADVIISKKTKSEKKTINVFGPTLWPLVSTKGRNSGPKAGRSTQKKNVGINKRLGEANIAMLKDWVGGEATYQRAASLKTKGLFFREGRVTKLPKRSIPVFVPNFQNFAYPSNLILTKKDLICYSFQVQESRFPILKQKKANAISDFFSYKKARVCNTKEFLLLKNYKYNNISIKLIYKDLETFQILQNKILPNSGDREKQKFELIGRSRKIFKINELIAGFPKQKGISLFKNKLSLGEFLMYGDKIFSLADLLSHSVKKKALLSACRETGASRSKRGGLNKPFKIREIRENPDFTDNYSLAIPIAGQIIHINQKKITLRRAQPIFISPKSILHIHDNNFVKKNDPVMTLTYQRLKTGDIVQGIPKVEQFFEARITKQGRLFRDCLPNLLKGLFKRYQIQLPLERAVRQSFYKIQQIIVDGVLRVYRSQGVTIADKHLEVIVRQMTSKVKIINGAQTGFFPGEIIDLQFVEKVNASLMKKIQYEPLILGITRAALQVDSFLSAASFQQTTRILSSAALEKKKDYLKGLKENILLGNLMPAGTGYIVRLGM